MEIKNLQAEKWYKSKTGNYFKFKEFRNNIFYSSEEIINKKWQRGGSPLGGGRGAVWRWVEELVEVPISEIQKYLLDGHVDKIKKSLVGRYIKWLRSLTYEQQFNVGDYSLIVYDNQNTIKLDGSITSFSNLEYNKHNWELMPEGFIPPTMKQELTELPEKWCIKVTNENLEILKKVSGQSSYLHTIIGAYLLYSKNNFDCWSWSSAFYIEITFAQFKRWVMKEEKPKEAYEAQFVKATLTSSQILNLGSKPVEQWSGGLHSYIQDTTIQDNIHIIKKNKAVASVEVLPLQKPCLISTKKKKSKLIFN